MLKKIKLLSFVIVFLCYASSAKAERNPQNQIDSLKNVLKIIPADTNRVKTLFGLAVIFRETDLNTSQKYVDQSLALSQQLNYKKGIAEAIHMSGLINYDRGNFAAAKLQYKKALALYDEIGEGSRAAEVIYHIATADYYMGDNKAAIDNVLKALKIYESLKDKSQIADCYIAMANIYNAQGNAIKDLEYNLKALKIKQELNDKYGIAACYTNIGNVYGEKHSNDTALIYYFKGLKIAKEIQDQSWTINTLGNIGIIYIQQKKFKEGLEYLAQCMDLAKKIGDKQAIASTYNTIGQTYEDMGDLEKAKQNDELALQMTKEIGSKNEIKTSYDNLASVYSKMGDYKNAYLYHKLYSAIKDTLLNESNSKQVTEMGAKYETEKKDNEITLLNKNNEIQIAKSKQQQIIIWAIGAGLFLVVILAFFIFKQFKQKQKANLALESAYIQIEEKNTSITDSINYAKRIQTAILPSIENIQKSLSEVFVLYKPKDIVSGDFYWFTEKNGYSIIAVADCTGHGVPGAFMSMIGNDLLTQIIIEKGINQPNLILTQLHEGVKTALKQDDRQSEAKDGMDIAIVKCKSGNGIVELEYSGALRPFWLVKNGEKELQEIKPDKHSIGGSYSNDQRLFTNHSLTLSKGDTFYLTTDGYADQFGGELGKKMMTKNMKELILSIQSSNMNEQKIVLENSFKNWQLDREQIDDVLVVGVRV
jgi:serine phosphatase RsbU (regulator of sigma subunit)